MGAEILQWVIGVVATGSVVAGTIKTMMTPSNTNGEGVSLPYPISCSFCSAGAIGHDDRGRCVCERHSVRIVEANTPEAKQPKMIPQPQRQARRLPAQSTRTAQMVVDPHDAETLRERPHQVLQQTQKGYSSQDLLTELAEEYGEGYVDEGEYEGELCVHESIPGDCQACYDEEEQRRRELARTQRQRQRVVESRQQVRQPQRVQQGWQEQRPVQSQRPQQRPAQPRRSAPQDEGRANHSAKLVPQRRRD